MPMRRLFLLMILALGPSLPAVAQTAKMPAPRFETAIFSGGCFWCMEHDMKAIPGVTAVMSGYTGGHLLNPTYRDVTGERSGHYEAVRVTYDASRISYSRLLDRYWPLVDPTDNEGQFCDRGPSSRPAVFVNGPAQRAAAEASRTKWTKALKSGKMATQVIDASRFYEAEAYHRNYSETASLNYNLYRKSCGRDALLVRVWGRDPKT